MSVNHQVFLSAQGALSTLLREPTFWSLQPLWWIATASTVATVVAATIARRRGTALRPMQLGGIAAGVCVLVLAFVSPIAALARGVLFSAHMLQHVLLLLALPLAIYAVLPRREADASSSEPSSIRGFFAAPLVGGILGVGAMWFWHDPVACGAALRHTSVAVIRDLSLVLAGLAFWYPVLTRDPRLRLAPPLVVAYLMTACVGCSALGVVMTFTTGSVCPAFGVAATPAALEPLRQAGFTRAVDQQLGGLLMWVPPCVLYAAISMFAMARWYRGESIDPVGAGDHGLVRTTSGVAIRGDVAGAPR